MVGQAPGAEVALCQGDPRLVDWAAPKIEADLREIVTAILAKRVPVDAVVLAGSLGRGEGALLAGEDGLPHLLSDYDVGVFSDALPAPSYYHGLTSELAPRLWGEKVTVGGYATASLSTLPAAQWSFDLRYGARVLYGDTEILERMPAYAHEDIPEWEALKLLFNYSAVLLEAADTPPGIAPGDSMAFRLALVRLLSRVADALALRGKCYQPRLAGRIDSLAVLPEFQQLPEEERTVLGWGCREKLTPRELPSFDPIERGRTGLRLVERVFVYSLGSFLASEMSSLPALIAAYQRRFRPRRSWNGQVRAALRLLGPYGPEGLPRSAWRADAYHYVLSTVPLVLLSMPGWLDRPAYGVLAARLLGVPDRATATSSWALSREKVLRLWHATF